ncbi:hypothetical protein [Streptomyces sp. NRRL B-3648]|uniref:hypothetical protein n=1 Tax=Streptomyces sp. NRRL B-3648 TaxID=1519493 RepID=UPI0006AE21E7|nr:hypothetical protein [Streptomyces sp. NRRL B-3648]KOV93006.1 hypothetical protein ADL04_28890 [Streptomyces sp. NRRL B-3648]
MRGVRAAGQPFQRQQCRVVVQVAVYMADEVAAQTGHHRLQRPAGVRLDVGGQVEEAAAPVPGLV